VTDALKGKVSQTGVRGRLWVRDNCTGVPWRYEKHDNVEYIHCTASHEHCHK